MTTMATTVPAEAVVMIDQLIDQTLQRAEQIMRQLPVRLRPTQPPPPSEQPVPAPRLSLQNRQETAEPVASSNKTPLPARASQSASSVSSRHAGTRSKASISSSSNSRKTRRRNVHTRRSRERNTVESKTKASSGRPNARTPPMSLRTNERVVHKADGSTVINEMLYLDGGGSGPLRPVVGTTKQTARPAGQHSPPIITDEKLYGSSDKKSWQIRRQIAIPPPTKGEQSLVSQRIYPVQHTVATARPEKPTRLVPPHSTSSSASATTTVTMNDTEQHKTTDSTETVVSPHALVVRGLEGADGLAFELSLIVKNAKTGRDRHIRIKADCPQFVPKNVWIDGRQIQ
jgi:hypothetical protein